MLRPGGRTLSPIRGGNWAGSTAAIAVGRHGGRHPDRDRPARRLLRGAGFEVEAVEDETDAWGVVLGERLRMYEKLRGEAEAAEHLPATTTSTSPMCCSSISCSAA